MSSDSDSQPEDDNNKLWMHLHRTVADLHDLRRETRELRRSLATLQARVDSLEREKAESWAKRPEMESSGMSAVRRRQLAIQLPVEILRQIFVHCLPERPMIKMNINHAPLVFLHVCAFWRRVAISLPEIWDTLNVDIPENVSQPVVKAKSWANGIENWIARSESRPLFISVLDHNRLCWAPASDPREPLILKIIEVLITHSVRWNSISLRIAGSIIKKHLIIQPSDVPLLETLRVRQLELDPTSSRLQGYKPTSPSNLRQDITGFHPIFTSPSLKSLDVTDVTMIGSAGRNFKTSRWENLLELSLGNLQPSRDTDAALDPVDAIDVLHWLQVAGSQLHSCRMTVDCAMGYFDSDPRIITLPSLRRLTIISYGEYSGWMGPFLASLKFPSLHCFEYKTLGSSQFSFSPFLRAIHDLEKLVLYVKGGEARRGELRECLQMCPRIRELCMSHEVTENFLAIPNPYLPELRTLWMDCTPPVHRREIYDSWQQQDGVVTKLTWEAIQTRIIERLRYSTMDRRIAVIQKICQCEQRTSPAQLKVSFRLDERLHKIALNRLASLIGSGLEVCFEKCYYDIDGPVDFSSPPPRFVWPGPATCASDES